MDTFQTGPRSSSFHQKRAEILERLQQLNQMDAQELHFVKLGRLDLTDHRFRHAERTIETLYLYQQADQLPGSEQ